MGDAVVLYEVGATASEEKELFNEIAAAKVTIPKVAGFSFSLPLVQNDEGLP